MFYSDSIMFWSTAILSVENTLNKIYLVGLLWYEFTYEYYNANNNTFVMLFQLYTSSGFAIIYHPSVVNEWRSNMDQADYEEKQNSVVYIPSENISLPWIISVDYWSRCLLTKTEWFQFQGILEHAAFHSKGDKILPCSLLRVFHMFPIRLWYDEGCNAKVYPMSL